VFDISIPSPVLRNPSYISGRTPVEGTTGRARYEKLEGGSIFFVSETFKNSSEEGFLYASKTHTESREIAPY